MANSRQRLSAAGWLGMILSGGLTFYWMQTYTGPFQWFAELQLRWMGQYTEKLTFLLTFLVAYGVLALIYLPVRRALRSSAEGSAGAGGGGNLSRLSGASVIALVGLGFAVMGAIHYVRAEHAGELADIPVAQLEAGQTPASSWLRVSGYAVPEAALTMESNRNKTHYVPVVSSLTSNLAHGRKPLPGRSDQPVAFEGIVERNDLPGPLRVSLEKENAIDPNNYYVLEPGKTPQKAMGDARIMSYIGLGMFGVAVILALVSWLRRPTSAAPANSGATLS